MSEENSVREIDWQIASFQNEAQNARYVASITNDEKEKQYFTKYAEELETKLLELILLNQEF